MAITSLDHINIRTADLAGTKAFFMDVLGLTEGWRPAFVGIAGCWLYVGDRAAVHLVEVPEPARASAGSALDHFAFAIDDYDDAVRRLEAAGMEFQRGGPPDGGIRQLFVTERNGVTFELTHRAI